MARTHWHYSGDVNLEHGGVFYDLSNWSHGYASAYRVVPCSDAGGPDNEFWIEELTVNRQFGRKEITQALDCIGMQGTKYEALTRARQAHVLFDALLSYGRYDQMNSRRVRIGKEPDKWSLKPQWDNTEPDIILRGNTSLDRYVRRCLQADEIVER